MGLEYSVLGSELAFGVRAIGLGSGLGLEPIRLNPAIGIRGTMALSWSWLGVGVGVGLVLKLQLEVEFHMDVE